MKPVLPTRAQRTWAPLSGIVFVVILLLGMFAAPFPPQPGDAAAEIRSYYAEHAQGVRVFVYAQALGTVFFLLFVCCLARALRARPHHSIAPDVTVASGVLVIAATLTGMGIFGGLAFGVAEESDPELVRALFDIGDMALNVGDFMLAVLVGVPSLVALRGDVLPRWVAVLGLVVAGAWALASVSIVVREGAFAGSSGPYGLTVVFGFLVWVVATSAAMYRGGHRSGDVYPGHEVE